jgi:hypothetical protein
MQRIHSILFLAGGVVAAGLGLGQSLASSVPDQAQAAGAVGHAPQDPVPSPMEQALAMQVSELERKVAALESWVAAQQKQSAVTIAALAEAEAEGFTAGINFKSREVLLANWRAEAAVVGGLAATEPLPEAKPKRAPR